MIEYRREIDGLRALAVLPVILFHAGFQSFNGGYIGVDIFFVISGYLITTILNSELERKNFTFINFYERRARRILPALFVVIIFSIFFAWYWLLPTFMQDFSKSIISVLLFSSNILFFKESGYFDRASELKPLLHTWSLGVEEQFYLLFPLILLLIFKVRRKLLPQFLLLIFLFSFLLAEYLSRQFPAAAFFLLPARTWELIMGALLAVSLPQIKQFNGFKLVSGAMGWLGLTLIFISIYFYSSTTPFPGAYALAPTLGAALIILFTTKQTSAGKFLGSNILSKLGVISYSAYLWHQPIFAFVRIRYGEVSQRASALLILLILFLAFVTYKFIETPLRSKKLVPKFWFFLTSLLISIIFIIFGYLGLKDGYAFRVQKNAVGDIGHTEFHRYIDRNFQDCEPKNISANAPRWDGFLRCKQSRVGDPNVILLGDSHAEHLFIGIAEALSKDNVVFYIPKASNNPLDELNGKPYISNPQFKLIFDHLNSSENKKTILIAMDYVDRVHNESDLYNGFTSTIKFLKKSGHKVILIGDTPQFNKDPEYCSHSLPYVDQNMLCIIPQDERNRQKNIYRPTLEKLSKENDLLLLDIDSPLCSEFGCSMVKNGVIFFRDNHHLNILGSRLIGSFIAYRLQLSP